MENRENRRMMRVIPPINPAEEEANWAREMESLAKVEQLLVERNWVKRIRRTDSFGEEDQRGVDIIVEMGVSEDEHAFGFPWREIGIQVKSSTVGTLNFWGKGTEIARKMGGTVRDYWMGNHGLILVNGNWAKEVILASMVYQFRWLMGRRSEADEQAFLSNARKTDPEAVECYMAQKELVEECCPWVKVW